MFRKITSLLLLAAAVFTAAAQDNDMGLAANERVIGYTVTNDIYPQSAYFGQAGTYPIGAYLSADRLRHYVGCRVVGMRVAVGAGAGRVNTWFHAVNDEGITTVNEQRQRLYEGWNNIIFNGNGYTIKEGEDLIFGYDYEETAEMVAAEQGYIAFTLEGDTYSGGGAIIFQNNTVSTLSGIGALCVQLIIDATNMPAGAIEFTQTLTVPRYRKKSDIFEAITTLLNVGRDPITQMTLGVQLDNEEPIYVECPNAIPSGGSYTWKTDNYSMEHFNIGTHRARIFVSKINGADVEPDEYNQYIDYIGIYENTVPRQAALIEGYPDQTSTLSTDIYDRMNSAGDLDGKACYVLTHKPGTTLACNASAELHDWYAEYGPYTYTSNRAYDMGEYGIATDISGLNSFPSDMASSFFKDLVAEAFEDMAFATLDIKRLYDGATNSVNVTVDVDALPDAWAICGDIALHIVLTENNVSAPQMMTGFGGRPTERIYNHNNVARLYYNGAKGTRLERNGDKATLTANIPLEAGWNPSNMKVVAYLTKWAEERTPAELKTFDVIACTSVPVGDPAGVEEVSADNTADGPSTYFTIGGVEVGSDNLAPGLYIERRADGTTRKVLIK